MSARRIVVLAGMGLATGLLAGCGSSDGNGPLGGGGNSTPSATVPYTPGTYQPSASLAAQCLAPRTGTDPTTGRPFPDRPGSAASENNFLRSWTNELYLWYGEVPDISPNGPSDPLVFFDRL